MTWEEICNDPRLQDLPYRIETDRFGRIVMSPTKFGHRVFQVKIAQGLGVLLPAWKIAVECAIETSDGVKVPDVVAVSPERSRDWEALCSMPQAPEICVEVLSFSNTALAMEEKRRLYAERNCLEFWICDLDGRMSFYSATDGKGLAQSLVCPGFPLSVA
jgi:Uma2 family endonuclease